jgi:predicted nucleic acid-binding protein
LAVINSLKTLPLTSDVFIDANIYLYPVMKRPKFFPPCHEFFTAIESGAYNGFTSTLVLNEVLHKLILAEATNTYGLRSKHDVANVLKQDPAKIRGLSQVWKTYSVIKDYPIIICSCDESILDMAVDLSNKYGLLISDATHLAVIKSEGISNIATNDTDFQRLNEIDVYKP